MFPNRTFPGTSLSRERAVDRVQGNTIELMVSRFASLLFAFHSTCYFSLSVSSGHAAAAAAVAGRRRLRQRRGRHLQRLPHDRIGAWTSLVGRDPQDTGTRPRDVSNDLFRFCECEGAGVPVRHGGGS